MMQKYLFNNQSFCTFASADRTALQTVRKGYSDSLSAFFFLSDNILSRNKMNKLHFNELPLPNSERWLDPTNLFGEIWKDVTTDGHYQVSNYGRLKSMWRGLSKKEKILRSCKTEKGYLCHNLMIDNKQRTKTIHIIVWETFCGKVPKGFEINHIDENKFNNTLENLNILTHRENVNWGTHNIRMAQTMSKNHRLSRKVAQYKDGVLINTFISLAECQRQTGFLHQALSDCCHQIRKSYKGYTWEFI